MKSLLIKIILGILVSFFFISNPLKSIYAINEKNLDIKLYSPTEIEILVIQESSHIIDLQRLVIFTSTPIIQITVSPLMGSISLNGTKITYTAGSRSGEDHLSIHIIDGDKTLDMNFNFLINALPKVPSLYFDNTGGTIFHANLQATDQDGDPLSYDLVTAPKKGYLLLDNETGEFTYVPDEEATSSDSFVVRIEDGKNSVDYTITLSLPLFHQNVVSEVLFMNSVILLFGFAILFILLREQKII